MKRIWNSIGKPTKDVNFQEKAVKHVEKLIDSTGKPTPAPKYPTEQKYFEAAQHDQKAHDDIHTKKEKLVANMNKMTIRSTNPPERWTSVKQLPTRESEWEHRHDPVWEYGFYEPPLEKMPPGKIMLRESIEALRAMQEAAVEGSSKAAVQMREKSNAYLADHVGVNRIGREKLDGVFEYFRPFERKDIQKVVKKADLERLQDALQGRSEEISVIGDTRESIKNLLPDKGRRREQPELTKKEAEQFAEAVKTLRAEEHERLHKRLGEIKEMEEEFTKAQSQKKEEKDEKK